MPPIPPGNQTTKGPKLVAEAERDTSKGHPDIQNSAEQGETANIKQNTTNAGFFKGRRVKLSILRKRNGKPFGALQQTTFGGLEALGLP